MKTKENKCKHKKWHWKPFTCSVICDKCGEEGSCLVSMNPETLGYEITLSDNPQWIPENKSTNEENELVNTLITEEYKQTDFYKHPLEMSETTKKSLSESTNEWETEFDKRFYSVFGNIDVFKDFIRQKIQEAEEKGYQRAIERCKEEKCITATENQNFIKKVIIEWLKEQKEKGYEPDTIIESLMNNLQFGFLKSK